MVIFQALFLRSKVKAIKEILSNEEEVMKCCMLLSLSCPALLLFKVMAMEINFVKLVWALSLWILII
jgi:hypothetical protein